MWLIAICIFILGVIAWFIVSLVMFLKTPKDSIESSIESSIENSIESSIEKRKLWKTLLIVSSCVLTITIVCIVSFIILLMLAIAHM